jgi:hypothetical protein
MVMKFVCLVLSAGILWATLPSGSRMPVLKGEFLTGKKAVLPDAAAGRVTLLALGFTYDSRFAVESWVKRFRSDFGTNPQVGFYEVPMIGGMAQVGKWFIDSGMRRGTPKEDHEHVITVYGNTRQWKERVGYKSPDLAYLLLLDNEGQVRWMHSGGVLEAAQEPSYQERLRVVTSLIAK